MEQPFVSTPFYLYITDFIFNSQHMSIERSKRHVVYTVGYGQQ